MDVFTQQLIQKHDTYQPIYGDTQKDYQCAYEMAHFYEFGCLPNDAYIIEQVEFVGDGYIFVHHDVH